MTATVDPSCTLRTVPERSGRATLPPRCPGAYGTEGPRSDRNAPVDASGTVRHAAAVTPNGRRIPADRVRGTAAGPVEGRAARLVRHHRPAVDRQAERPRDRRSPLPAGRRRLAGRRRSVEGERRRDHVRSRAAHPSLLRTDQPAIAGRVDMAVDGPGIGGLGLARSAPAATVVVDRLPAARALDLERQPADDRAGIARLRGSHRRVARRRIEAVRRSATVRPLARRGGGGDRAGGHAAIPARGSCTCTTGWVWAT